MARLSRKGLKHTSITVVLKEEFHCIILKHTPAMGIQTITDRVGHVLDVTDVGAVKKSASDIRQSTTEIQGLGVFVRAVLSCMLINLHCVLVIVKAGVLPLLHHLRNLFLGDCAL